MDIDFSAYIQDFIWSAPVQELEVFAMHREHWLLAKEYNVEPLDKSDDNIILGDN